MVHLTGLSVFILCCLTVFVSPRKRNHKKSGVATEQTQKAADESLRFAICLTGQVVRLELGSKIENLLNTNLKKGFHISLFILLDNELDHVKAVKDKNRFTSEKAIYANHSAVDIQSLILKQVSNSANLTVHVRLEPPKQAKFVVNGGVPPVHPSNPVGNRRIDRKRAAERLQSHMIWQSGLRECVRWMQAVEVASRTFFDFVMRLREDTFVFKKFYFYPSGYKSKLVSLASKGWGGVNDHNLIIDRAHADNLFRYIFF
jgi:hypothetical protein